MYSMCAVCDAYQYMLLKRCSSSKTLLYQTARCLLQRDYKLIKKFVSNCEIVKRGIRESRKKHS